MGGFVAMSMLTSLLMVLAVGLVLFIAVRKIAAANSGSGGAPVAAMADPVPGTLLVTASALPSRNALIT
jgi:hypothetical protein